MANIEPKLHMAIKYINRVADMPLPFSQEEHVDRFPNQSTICLGYVRLKISIYKVANKRKGVKCLNSNCNILLNSVLLTALSLLTGGSRTLTWHI